MNATPAIHCRFDRGDINKPYASVIQPRKLIVKSGFGALPRRSWIELYNDDLHTPARLGDWLSVDIDGIDCFHGRLAQIRLDSEGDHLTLFAENEPAIRFASTYSGRFESQSISSILTSLAQAAGLSYDPDPECTRIIDRLEFENHSIISAIDLLAKLAGNWGWRVGDCGALKFRPILQTPDHCLRLPLDRHTVNVWERLEPEGTPVDVLAGLSGNEELSLRVYAPELGGAVSKRFYARPIATQATLNLLGDAIASQLAGPHYSRTVDVIGDGFRVNPGDTLRLLFDQPLPRFPEDQLFRVKQRELTYAHETLSVRFHLTTGFESGADYLDGHDRERVIGYSYLDSRIGPFQMDVSSLDSAAYFDAA